MCAGELFFIGYEMDKKPACVWYAGLDKEGALKFDVKVPLQVCIPHCLIYDRPHFPALSPSTGLDDLYIPSMLADLIYAEMALQSRTLYRRGTYISEHVCGST